MSSIIAQLFLVFMPIVTSIISEYRKNHNDANPTDEDIIKIFNSNVEAYLREGEEWLAAHPKDVK